MPYFRNLSPLAYLRRPFYWLRDDFLTNAIAPLTSPRNAEPGPGTWTIVDTLSALQITDGKLRGVRLITADVDPRIVSQALGSAVVGRTFLSRIRQVSAYGGSGGFHPITWTHDPTAPQNNGLGVRWSGDTSIQIADRGSFVDLNGATVVNDTFFNFALALRETGYLFFFENKLHWVGVRAPASTPLYAAIAWHNNSSRRPIDVEYAHVRDLPAPFSSGDYGLATFHETAFTQSAGAELLTNSDFSDGTGTFPTGWTYISGTLGGDPGVSNSAAGGGAGTGSAKFTSSATAFSPALGQNILTVGRIYEIGLNITAYTNGTAQILDNAAGWNNVYTSAGNRRTLQRAGHAQFILRLHAAVPATWVADDVTVKELTLNTAKQAQADGIFDAFFTLPVSPIAGQEFHYVYRMSAAGDEFLTCWDLYLRRNDGNTAWDIRLDSIASGTRTNRLAVTGVGTPTGMRVIADGSLHDVYTYDGSTWTKRGSQVNVSHQNAGRWTNLIYSTGFTPSAWDHWPRYSQQIDDVLSPKLNTYLLRDEFYTPQSAAQGTRIAEPSGHSYTLIDSGTGAVDIFGGRLRWTETSPGAFDTLGFVAGPYARVAGRALRFHLNSANWSFFFAGWDSKSSLGWATGTNNYFYEDGPTPSIASNTVSTALPFAQPTANVDHELIVALRANGHWQFMRGGALTDWTLMFVNSVNSTDPVYAHFNNRSLTGAMDYVRIYDLPHPFTSDFGAAIVNKTSFEQSVGAELLTNGDLAAWSGDNPTGWTVAGEVGSDPMITQVAAGGGAGTGSARFYSSASSFLPRMTQAAFTVGRIYEVGCNITARVSGGLNVLETTGAVAGNGLTATYTTTGARRMLGRALGTEFRVQGSTAPTDVTIDDLTVKELTLSTAQQTAPDGWHYLEFTTPVSPIAGQEVHLLYRIQNAGDELRNCWDLYLRRNDGNTDWDIYLDSISAGIRTSRLTVTAIGATTAIAVHAFGSLHDVYSRSNLGYWYKRGSQVNVTHLNGATGINEIHSTGFTVSRLHSWARDYVIESTPRIDTTSLSQTIGAEALTDGGFENWTSATNLTSWSETVNGGSTVNRTADVQSGSFALRIDTDASSNVAAAIQNAGTASVPYEVSVYAKANLAAKSFRFETNVTSGLSYNAPTAGYQLFRTLAFMNTGTAQHYMVRSSAASSSLYFDNQSAKPITAMTTLSANPTGVFELDFTLPVSPVAGESIILRYRQVDQINFVAVMLSRNETNTAWDLHWGTHTGAARTTISSATGVGSPTKIRVTVLGNGQVVETEEAGVRTFRLATTNSTHSTAGGLSAVWNSGFTPSRLRWYRAYPYYNQWLEEQ